MRETSMPPRLLRVSLILVIALLGTCTLAGEDRGYSPLKAGTVRIWDANNKYTMKHYDMRAWPKRVDWSQAPYGVTDYVLQGEALLEGENFWVSLHSSPHDAVFVLPLRAHRGDAGEYLDAD